MASRVVWRGEEFNRRTKNAISIGINRAGTFLLTAAQQEVSRPNTGQRRTRKRATSRGKKGSSFAVYPSPSKKGEAPRLRTGHGRGAIVHEHDKRRLESRVGIRKNAMYMLWT